MVYNFDHLRFDNHFNLKGCKTNRWIKQYHNFLERSNYRIISLNRRISRKKKIKTTKKKIERHTKNNCSLFHNLQPYFIIFSIKKMILSGDQIQYNIK